MIDHLTRISQQQFVQDVMSYEGVVPSRQRIIALYGYCVIDVPDELTYEEAKLKTLNEVSMGIL